MSMIRSYRRVVTALALFVAFLFQGTWALAGTTGTLSGTVTDTKGAPVAGATVIARSSSDVAVATTDSSGHFVFLDLPPDTYSVTVEKAGFQPVTEPGVTVFADQNFVLAFHLQKSLKTIAKVTATAAGNLVKQGVTSDIYSVNSATQQVIAASAGGYNLNAAYSGIYQQPGVTSYIGNYGWGQVFYIRGGAYSQTGYEFDGVPVNRAFDNYQANSLSTLGQQELQVYTGGSPAGAVSETLGGYINQVIKTGTYPGYADISGGIGTPNFYHSLQAEVSGASPNRMFSYYVGLLGFNQTYPTINNQNGGNIATDGSSSYGLFGTESQAPFFGGMAADGLPYMGFYTNADVPACQNLGTAPAGSLFPGVCNSYGPFGNGYQQNLFERDSVVNFHLGIPHRNGTGRDDVQLLFDNSMQYSINESSINDQGGLTALNNLTSEFPAFDNALGITSWVGQGGPNNNLCAYVALFGSGACATTGGSPIPYADGFSFAPGTQFGQLASTANVVHYLFPNSPSQRAFQSGISTPLRDGFWNDVGIVKLQYTRNINENSYARLFGYTFYSDWLIGGPDCSSAYYNQGFLLFGGLCGNTPDYELNTHTRGLYFTYANQINPANLLTLDASYTTAAVDRTFNYYGLGTLFDGPNAPVTTLTNGNPSNPLCFNYTTGAQTSCFSPAASGTYINPIPVNMTTACAAGGPLAGTAACTAGAQFLVTVPGQAGPHNTVAPKFSAVALTDDFRPNDKLDLNLGVRFERFEYDLANTNTPEDQFWFNAYSQVACYDPATGLVIFKPLSPITPPPPSPYTTSTPGGACPTAPSGQPGVHPTGGVGPNAGSLLFSPVSPNAFVLNEFSPRLGGTYALNPNTILRFSVGKYTQPTETAFEQYANLSGKFAASFDYGRFWNLGFTNPGHNNPVQYSINYDVSLEKHVNGTDLSFKLTPFYRDTHNETVYLPLGPGFISGANFGHQHSSGVEFELMKGNPTLNGWSGALSYTYTKAVIRYGSPPSGINAIDYINSYITAFNALTAAGGGAKCYNEASPTGPNGSNAPDPTCANPGSDILNPYYSMSPQPLLDRNGWYPTYPNEPPNDPSDTAVGSTAIAPNVFAGWLQYKHGRFAIAPNFQLNSGTYYGYPTAIYGTDPRDCTANQAADGRVAATSPYATAADYLTCGPSLFTYSGYLAIPDPVTGLFDGIGAYREPWQLNIGAQLRYDLSQKVTATLNLANLVNRCFGGAKMPWSSAYAPNSIVCGYGVNTTNYLGATPGAGFFYGASPSDPANGTAPVPKVYSLPYAPFSGGLPFQAYLQVQVKL